MRGRSWWPPSPILPLGHHETAPSAGMEKAKCDGQQLEEEAGLIEEGAQPPACECRRVTWVAEARTLAALAAPVVIQMATQQAMVVTDQVMVGHLGADELAAAALGNTVRTSTLHLPIHWPWLRLTSAGCFAVVQLLVLLPCRNVNGT